MLCLRASVRHDTAHIVIAHPRGLRHWYGTNDLFAFRQWETAGTANVSWKGGLTLFQAPPALLPIFLPGAAGIASDLRQDSGLISRSAWASGSLDGAFPQPRRDVFVDCSSGMKVAHLLPDVCRGCRVPGGLI